MDIRTRKYNLIQELIKLDKENILTELEAILKQQNKEEQELSKSIKTELDKRLEDYHKNPDDAIDWESVKNNW